MAQVTPPPFDATVEDVTIPPFEATQEDMVPPAFEDTVEEADTPQTASNLGKIMMADMGSSALKAVTAATRVNPLVKVADFVQSLHGKGMTSQEFITEMEGASDRSRDEFGVDPKAAKGLLPNVASGMGTMVPTLLSNIAAPLTAGLMSGESGFREAEQAGATKERQIMSGIGNAATAVVSERLLGVIPMLKSIKNSASIPLTGLKSKVERALLQAGKGFVREGLQETSEQIVSDLMALGLYDEKRKVFDLRKLFDVFVAGGVVGSGVSGGLQFAHDTTQQAIAPKQVMQDAAQAVDESLAQTLQAEPPPISEVTPSVRATPQGTPILSPEEIQAVPEAQPGEVPLEVQTEPATEFVGTAINTPEGLVTKEPGTAHPEMLMEALDKGLLEPEVENNLGFAFKRPDGQTEWVDRVEAGRRLTESGQLTGLPEGTPLTSEHIRNEVEGVTFTKAPVTDANTIATNLQQFVSQGISTAKSLGATDLNAEEIVSDAQREIAQQIASGKSTGQSPKALFMQAVKNNTANAVKRETALKRGGGKVVSGDVKSEEGATLIEQASTPVGPRSTTVSQEDISLIDQAISKLPENQSKVMRTLADNPDLTDKELSAQLGLTIDQVKKAKSQARASLLQYIQDNEIGKSMGPGAASASEVLVQYEERKFGKRFQESEDIAPEVRARTGDRYYEPIPNRVTAQRARELIELRGDEDVQKEIQDERTTISYADRSTVGQILIKKYNDQYKAIEDKKSDEALRLLDKAAELAEWAADFGTRLGQGVQSFAMWDRLAPDGKLRAYENIVKKKRSNFIRENRNDVDEIKDAANTEGSPQKKLDALRKLNNPTAKKVRKKMGKLTQLGTLTDEKFLEATASELGLPVFGPDVQREILRLAHLIDEAPEGMPRMEATLALNKYLAQQRGFDPSDLLFGVYYGNILSGGWTQAINLVDTSLNVLNEVNTLAIQNPKAAAQIAAGLARGVSMGKYDSMMSIMNGRRISDGKFVEDPFFMEVAQFGKKGGVPLKTDTKLRRAVKAIAETPAATPLNLYKYVGRVMSASDSLAARGAMEAKSAQLAWKLANGENIDSILGYDRVDEFRAQAKSEGYTGAAQEARTNELMMMSRPEELQKAARDFASDSTYNIKPYGLMGAISNKIESFTRDYKIGKLVVPFTRIVANVVNRGLNNSPYGFIRAMRGKAGKGKSERVFSPEERNAMLVRATVSTTLMALMVTLHESGALTIHGAGPSDPEKKKQLKQTGWKPYTIQIGDQYYAYTYTPWGLMMAATGNWLDNDKYKDFGSKEGLDKLAYATQSVASTVFNQSFLSGLSTMFDIIAGKSPAQQVSAGKRFVSSTVSGLAVPFSSALKDIESVFGSPNVPKVENMREAMISSIPFASQYLKPQLNALGEPVKSIRNRLFSGQKEDPVWKLISDKGLRIPVPNTFFDNPEEQYQYLKEQGGLLRKWIETNSARLKNMDSKNAQDALENAADAYRSRTRTKFLRKGALKKVKKGEV